MKLRPTAGSTQIRPRHVFSEFKKEEVEQSVPGRFEKIVHSHPDRLAIKSSDQTWTYAELNAMANRIARAILARRKDSPEPIALLLEQGTALIASMLGVWKAGKFFVLLDPSFPAATNEARLKDSLAELIVTDRQDGGSATEIATGGQGVIELSSIADDVAADDLRLRVSPESFAYITYTSGTTGQPKGVVQNHRNILHDTMLLTNVYKISMEDRCSLLASSTSVAVKNACFALLNGASVLTFDVKKEGITGLSNWLSRERISICRCDVQLFREFCEGLTGEAYFPDLRLIEFVGDTRLTSDIELWKEHFPPDCLLANGFASSEAGYVTDCLIDHETAIEDNELPTGLPLEDKEIILLNETGSALGCNQVGEIAVKSSYLSPGYWRRPELTEARFRQDPEEGDRRMFLTGDLGLLLPDGCLVYRGRKDFRVKIRGYTIEIAEVENALLRHSCVKEAAVVAWDQNSGEKYLVAYVVPRQDRTPTISQLSGFLREKLPDYMAPSAFVFMDSLPLTNGKLDRKSLPKPDNRRPDLSTPYDSPRNEVEERLVHIWEEVLDVRPIGIHDNFFDLGGHSLRAMRIAGRVSHDFQVAFSPSLFFEASTIAHQAAYLATASQTPIKDILPIPRNGRLPLSFSQQRLWFLNQLDPESPAYNEPKALRLKGSLNIEALQKSLDALVLRHEILRSTVATIDGVPMQVINPGRPVKLERIELSDGSEDRNGLQRVLREISRRSFDLTKDLMLRAALLRLGHEDHVLLLVTHHIASDGWSTGILFQELSDFYDAFSTGLRPSLPELAIQYADFAGWQREQLKGEVLDNHLSYWKQQLRDLPVLRLPTDHPRPIVQTHRGGILSVTLSKTVSDALKSLSQREEVTMFMTLLAAWKTVFHRYTGQDDIVVGAAIAGRNRPEVEGLIGFFINALVLRTDLSGNPTFRELLARVRKVCLEAYAHQDLPFEKLVEELRPQRDLGLTPLFQVFFNTLNFEGEQLHLNGLRVEPLAASAADAKFDLTLYAREQSQEIQLRLVYNIDLFSRERMAESLEQLDQLLLQIVRNPDERIASFSLVTPACKEVLPNPARIIRSDWGGSVHERLSQQAHRTPGKVAVRHKEAAWTYGELNSHCNQLAHCLLDHRIQPNDLVAIYGHRSATLVWALLGVLKAGAAFVILDPVYPTSRLIERLRAAKPRVWLQIEAAGSLPGRLKEFLTTSSCRLQLELPSSFMPVQRLMDYPTDDPEISVGPDELAYVAFTSGSTGEPKGILGTHRPLSHFLQWHTQFFGLNESDRFSFLSGLSHDPALRDILAPLWSGATLCIPDSEHIGSADYLTDWLKREEITIAHLTPAMIQLLSGATPLTARASPPSGAGYSRLRYVFSGGDILTKRDVVSVRDLFPSVTCVNFYGATETPQAMGYFIVPEDKDDLQAKEIIPLGRGIEGVQLLVLNDARQLAGVGELGEIYVRTPYLTRGYLDDDTLTHQRFIVSPFTPEIPGDRLYRTGDKGRYLPDGSVEFAGRTDDQVKIRAFRVELGEIEAALRQHPAVQESVVLARSEIENPRTDGSENPKSRTEPSQSIENLKSVKRLVAYLVIKQGTAPTTSELRAFLEQKLPEYMAPSVFVTLDALPLTPNGKIDRRGLPAPDPARPELEQTFVAPRNPVEERLAAIWAHLLGLDQVGIHDNFFDLGGHSLSATQVISQVREAFDLGLPLRALFEDPTVAGLAARIAHARAQEAAPENTANVLAELESLSDEQAQLLLAQESSNSR
jgi:amino acid adenylation domain-containing protein